MLGDNIRKYRKENNISQESLGEKLGVSRQSISLWENNQTQPSLENIVALAKIFNVTTDDLLSNNEQERETVIEKKDTKLLNKNRKTVKKFVLIIIAFVLVVGTVLFVFRKNIFPISAKEVYNIVKTSTIELRMENDTGFSTGTGFFVDSNGTIVTNFHVIERASSGYAIINNEGKYDIKFVLGYDEDLDIAILKIDYSCDTVLEKRTAALEVGETVYALGSSEGLTNSFSSGIISALDRVIEGNKYIQTTAPISRGNSGGPLIDAKGRVVGITTAAIAEGQNLNLAIPIERITLVPRDKDWTMTQFYNLTDPDRLTFDEITNKVSNQVYVINVGEYKSTIHKRNCSLVKNLIDSWYKNGIDKTCDLWTDFQSAINAGYKKCDDCDCFK